MWTVLCIFTRFGMDFEEENGAGSCGVFPGEPAVYRGGRFHCGYQDFPGQQIENQIESRSVGASGSEPRPFADVAAVDG